MVNTLLVNLLGYGPKELCGLPVRGDTKYDYDEGSIIKIDV